MALDAEYFDSIYIEVVKRKYYEASKVQAVFEDIRRQAEALNAENERLRREQAEVTDRKVELGEVLLNAQTIYQEIVGRANEKAAAITDEAQRRGEEILEEARRQSQQLLQRSRNQEEVAARRVEEAFDRMKQLHQQSIEALNAQWQEFLRSLDPETDLERGAEAQPEPTPEEPGEGNLLPADLEEKVGAIASQLFSLEET